MAFVGSEVGIQGDAYNTVGRDQYVYNLNLSNLKKAFRSLAERAAINACYDSEQRFPPPNCHPGTRANILATLSEWIESDLKTTKIFWIYGSAGVGKSAIAQNLSEKYASNKLAAAFFFSRNDSTRDKLEPVVATIAYQFCKSGSPLKHVLGPIIIETLRSDPEIFRASHEVQFQKLIIEPCSKVEPALWENLPNAIVIDGLDECVHLPSQERFLALIQRATTSPLPAPWVFIICSRPELHIRDVFDHQDFGEILRRLAVTPSAEAYQDVRRYLVDKFAILRNKHRALRCEGASWPGDDSIDQLVKRADGQFIFAVTVIKYIDTRDEPPQDRLDAILRVYVGHGSESPYSDLDLLYRQILSTCPRWHRVQPVLRLLVTPDDGMIQRYDEAAHWRSLSMIELLLNLKGSEIVTSLAKLHSVLLIPEGDHSNIYIAHASFTEFICDINRSGEYHAPQMTDQEYSDCVTTLLLRTLSASKAYYPPHHPQSVFTTSLSSWVDRLQIWDSRLHFSCKYWYGYCTEVDSPSPGLLAALRTFDPYSAVAVHLFYDSFPALFVLEDVIEWAESFGESTQDFVKICKSFLHGFYVAFPPDTPRNNIFWWTFRLERCLYNSKYYRNWFQRDAVRKLFAVTEYEDWVDHLFVMLLSDSDTPVLPGDWAVVYIAKANGEVFQRVAGALCDHKNGLELLLDDVREDACETVLQELVQDGELFHLKALMNERRKSFFPEYVDWPSDEEYYSLSESSSEYSGT
uniref:Nephrocystin 3-like N-terminal domain-containing protein n=1 Tax=Moniliophthora roreri TaxID=221103 RepID=A0A0W0F426_MONRR